MTWQVLITVFTLGGIGAMVRGTIIMILANSARIFPMSILLVNMLAAFLGGFLLSLQLPEGIGAALSVGLVGGIGTLSSIHGNLMDLFFDKAYRRLALYLGITIFGGVLIAQAGMSTGTFVVNLLRGPQSLQNELLLDSLRQQQDHLEELKQQANTSLKAIDPKLLDELDPNHAVPNVIQNIVPNTDPNESNSEPKSENKAVPNSELNAVPKDSSKETPSQETESAGTYGTAHDEAESANHKGATNLNENVSDQAQTKIEIASQESLAQMLIKAGNITPLSTNTTTFSQLGIGA